MNLTQDNLNTINPKLKVEMLVPLFEKYEINTLNRVCGFLAQCAHESGNFRCREENLNYSAQGLAKVFPKYFKDKDTNEYARKPEKIANLVYANRMGNGDEASGDGYRYRGRGYIQLTGKENYTRFAKSIDRELSEAVEYCTSDEGALESALYFWKRENLNKFCDNDDIKAMTKRINGGFNGLEERQKKYEMYKGIFA
ncbi:glycoside hydrolase [Helicobacter didelphidarum]|uniref:Glycoside hydrolase n=1 Tax=Helicobacter didelphidarum TaxID=2040648 RepID=A0A3D8IAH7_9HELI|nr:glycoside hydrolase family 19 protein [Helicobacter didelphidarum]RDU62055.1 glycoside hydrolase [Helicobacter didelphidarum]